MLLIFAILAFLSSAGLTWYLSRPDAKLTVLAEPNARSLHIHPVPATGGLGILSGVLLSTVGLLMMLNAPSFFIWIALGALVIAVISFLDDWRTLPVAVRLPVHMLAAGLLLSSGFGDLSVTVLHLPGLTLHMTHWLALLLSLLFIVWMINLYNFMDGMDGFAGGMTLFGFGGMAVLGALSGDAMFAGFNLLIASAAAGFLLFNFPPARIFMGDTGASTLGFLVAANALWAERAALFPLWMTVLLFLPFIMDATVTLLRRLLRGEKIWQAHKTHYYQQLISLGWSHRFTVLWEYLLMSGCSLSVLIIWQAPASVQWLLIISWFLTGAVLMWRIEQWLQSVLSRH